MRQDITDYKLELKISEYMLVNFEFLILIWNFEFWILKFEVLWAQEAWYLSNNTVPKYSTESKYWKFCML